MPSLQVRGRLTDSLERGCVPWRLPESEPLVTKCSFGLRGRGEKGFCAGKTEVRERGLARSFLCERYISQDNGEARMHLRTTYSWPAKRALASAAFGATVASNESLDDLARFAGPRASRPSV